MRILLVEDDRRIAREIATALEAAGFTVEHETDGEEAWQKGRDHDFAAVVLDLGLPRLDGLALLKRWRGAGRDMPVLVLSARGDWIERVEGIDAGADDYLPKPFRIEEAVARLRAILRRTASPTPALRIGALELDTRQMRVSRAGAPVALTPQEYRLVAHLMANAGRVVPQAELLGLLYADDPDKDANAIEVLVGRVRRKLGAAAIETRRGLGYVMAGEPP